jgi:hypothetical protein
MPVSKPEMFKLSWSFNMKKLLVLIVLVIAGVSVATLKKEDHKTIPFFGAKAIKTNSFVSPESKGKTPKSVEAASYESLEENFSELELSELKSEIDKVNSSREKLQLIETFNKRKLTESEEKALAEMIRTRVVLTKLMMDKELEELERL